MVAQEDRPLAVLRYGRCLLEDVHYGEPVLHLDRHEQPWHQREVERHVAFVAVAEVGGGVLGPLVGLGEEHPILVPLREVSAQVLQLLVGLREGSRTSVPSRSYR